jgi:hypothetical protein
MPKSLMDLNSRDFEEIINFMRADLESDMQLSKERDIIISITKKMFEDEGRDFYREFKEWKKDGKPVLIPREE